MYNLRANLNAFPTIKYATTKICNSTTCMVVIQIVNNNVVREIEGKKTLSLSFALC